MIDWGKMWGRGSDEHLRVIRVKTEYINGGPISIANAFNNTIWIRRPLNSLVDPGVYNIGFDGGLVKRDGYRASYPDLDLKMPDFQKMAMIKSFSLEELEEIRFGLQKLKEARCDIAWTTSTGIYSSALDWEDDDFEAPMVSIEKDWFSKLPIEKGEALRINRQDYELAIDEMMFYQGTKEVVLLHPIGRDMPLVFGVSPEACAILSDRRKRI